jgi:hypothetical protein
MSRRLGEKKISFWALLVAMLAIPVSVLLTYWTIARSEQLARDTGQYGKARPHVFVENASVDGPLTLYIGAQFASRSVTVVPIPVAVRNEGEKTMKAIELTIRLPAFMGIDNDVLEATVESELPIEQAPKRHFARIGPYAYSSFSLPDLHPGQTVAVNDLMKLEESLITNQFSARTKDGVSVSGDFFITVGFPLRVSLAGEDLRSTDYDFDVIGVKSTSKSDLLRAFTEMAAQERAQYRNKVGLWRYVLSHLDPTKRCGVLIYPGFKEYVGPDGGTLQMGTVVSSTTASYQIP